MASPSYAMLPQTKASLDYIIEHHRLFLKDRQTRGLEHKAMVVGVSGCQGSGKTTLCDTLVHLLRQAPYDLNVVSFSLDDLYLTREAQVKLAARYPDNRLLQYRGQPGSHDLELAETVFDNLLKGDSKKTVYVPAYDKSLHGGLGDRLPEEEWQQVQGRVDIILFEGWSLGFKSVTLAQLQHMYEQSNLLQQHGLHDLAILNDFLVKYEEKLYPKMDIFLHLAPIELEQVYQWRLQQEHHMQQTRNVKGLSDEAVRTFVDTYMPAYTLYLSRLNKVGFFGVNGERQRSYEGWYRKDGGYSDNTLARHLRLVLDHDRRMVQCQDIHPVRPLNNNGNHSGNWIIRKSSLILTTCAVGYIGWVVYQRRQPLLQGLMKIVHQFTE
ncbi:P-loop containing nucleoside triphosphate hydrolase protein [Halteromyces radiatus]|uniref:P-loop containing nucleoside triphosphate hydrolase protein n=1 Tax=Halteromyces radiatus TaxID=101107 RepID=UPI00221F00C8|nr:P-loop containing nucleoside triphosphate hydrolase protein [Halteromyces radiatus]KAI8085136.1 P-loop containing nucleoside triphosphate hydrolase protein [Halteromyces radiatus]